MRIIGIEKYFSLVFCFIKNIFVKFVGSKSHDGMIFYQVQKYLKNLTQHVYARF